MGPPPGAFVMPPFQQGFMMYGPPPPVPQVSNGAGSPGPMGVPPPTLYYGGPPQQPHQGPRQHRGSRGSYGNGMRSGGGIPKY
ncbi:unnamed protein product [Ambrosiozyma monospora]|nr:unnamed protein product [Ambrosiozyma monospora]